MKPSEIFLCCQWRVIAASVCLPHSVSLIRVKNCCFLENSTLGGSSTSDTSNIFMKKPNSFDEQGNLVDYRKQGYKIVKIRTRLKEPLQIFIRKCWCLFAVNACQRWNVPFLCCVIEGALVLQTFTHYVYLVWIASNWLKKSFYKNIYPISAQCCVSWRKHSFNLHSNMKWTVSIWNTTMDWNRLTTISQ